ncbi:hypothetical protein EDC44_1492 [Cricetibacter osteomyelitidis]|uniref:Toxin VasX N-terminal region domain-containing protein n=1 Tax=Cricetibacter osteomyelitidis TaxID=1521931 RepID=A0A4R2SIA9_9PAST|nr:toxin VasX [Cricetibacter osteomyelitidis]TCP88790.1 hypothetical protein EDC44_1492 [Cricetibacter osteomyelitidis]
MPNKTNALTDPRIDPNALTIGQPLACQLDIVPIFPVRFSLTANALNNAAQTGTVPPMPTGIADPNYDLRRLRQGYLYILARVKHVGHTTDEKKRWLIFEYNVSKDDSNAPNPDSWGLPYHFSQYVWADGTARGEWKKLPRSFPYAYVHAQVGEIECAYSEIRWTPEMFEKLEHDVEARKKIMQKIPLSGTGEFIFPGKELAEKVADFQPTKAGQDKNDSYRRATGIGYHPEHKVFEHCTAKKTMVIALFDRIGDAKDISMYHQVIHANGLNEFAKLLYPVTTAKAIEQIEQHVYKNPNWAKRLMSSDPVAEGMREQIKYYAQKSPLMEENIMQNLAKAQFTLLNQSGNGTPQTKMALLEALCKENEKQWERLASMADYAMAYYGTAMAGLGNTPKGMEYQKKLLLTGASWGDNLANLLSIGEKLNQLPQAALKKLSIKALRFDVTIDSIMSAQLSLWEEGVTNAIPYRRFLAAAGLTLETLSVSYVKNLNAGAAIVNKQMHTLIKNSDKLFAGLSAAHYRAELTKHIRAGTSHYINMNVHIVVKNEHTPATRLIRVNETVGTFFAGASLIVNLKEWMKYKSDNSGSLSAWFLHPAVRLTNDFAALVGSLERTNKSLVKEAMATFYRQLDSAAVKQIHGLINFKTPIGIETKVGKGLQLSRYLTLQNVGRFANVLGVVISIAQAIKETRTGNTSARNAAIMAGMAEVSFFISTFAYTGVFIGIGAVLAITATLTSLVSDNEFELWVRTGFWGESREYWGDKRDDKIQGQISKAEKLSSNAISDEVTTIKAFFEAEMEGFYNLVWGIGIDTTLANQYQLKAYCPAFRDESSVNKLEVEIHITDYTPHSALPMESYVSVPIPTDKVRKAFLSEGEILIDLTQINTLRHYRYMRKSQGTTIMNSLTVKVKYPKLGEDVSNWWYRFNADYFESEISYTGVR